MPKMPRKQKKEIEFNPQRTGFLRFKRSGDEYLVTNDIGEYAFLTEKVFSKLAAGTLDKKSAEYKDLSRKGFVRDYMDFAGLADRWREKNHFLFSGPALHIAVLTRRCNHDCVYCHASSKKGGRGLDMTKETALKVLDSVFASPAPSVTIEFQGGEPLLNWPVLEFMVKEAAERLKTTDKKVGLSLVTNLSAMTAERLDFLLKHNVAICTSLDGPADLHNKNRVATGGGSHAEVLKWWKIIKKRTARSKNGPDALLTVTKQSLGRHKDIVDEYVRIGARSIFLRFLNPFGAAKKAWGRIGYTAREYIEFYTKALDYVIDLNLKKKASLVEHTARIFLRKILTDTDPNFMDLRSPCGAGIGQIAYDYDGRVFTCDEGRMLAAEGTDAFCMGDLKKEAYADLAASPTVKCVVTASVTDIQTLCSSCVYKPYCGVCPVFNYSEHNDLYMHHPNFRCEIYTGVMDYLFARLREPKVKKLFESWAGSSAGVAGIHV